MTAKTLIGMASAVVTCAGAIADILLDSKR